MRAFIAIDLDHKLKEKVGDFVRKLKKTGAAVKWVDTSGMHLTLKFLGEIDPDTLPAVEGDIRRVASLFPRFSLLFEGTGCFPSEKRPRVFWIGCEEQPVLTDLQKSLEEGLAGLGFPSEDRAFHPHLTIGRAKGPVRLSEAVVELQKDLRVRFGEMNVERLTLFESTLKPEGAVYRVLAEFELT